MTIRKYKDMKIYNAQDNSILLKKEIVQYLNKYEDDGYCYDTPYYFSHLLSDESNYSNIDFVLDNELKGVLLKIKSSSIDFIKLIGNFNEHDFPFLLQAYSKSILVVDSCLPDKSLDCYRLCSLQ